jgi:hypothetical protein
MGVSFPRLHCAFYCQLDQSPGEHPDLAASDNSNVGNRGSRRSSNVFPADENRIYNIGINRFVNRIARLLVRVNVIDGAIALHAISKRHGDEKLMITFAVGVHGGEKYWLAILNQCEAHAMHPQQSFTRV